MFWHHVNLKVAHTFMCHRLKQSHRHGRFLQRDSVLVPNMRLGQVRHPGRSHDAELLTQGQGPKPSRDILLPCGPEFHHINTSLLPNNKVSIAVRRDVQVITERNEAHTGRCFWPETSGDVGAGPDHLGRKCCSHRDDSWKVCCPPLHPRSLLLTRGSAAG